MESRAEAESVASLAALVCGEGVAHLMRARELRLLFTAPLCRRGCLVLVRGASARGLRLEDSFCHAALPLGDSDEALAPLACGVIGK